MTQKMSEAILEARPLSDAVTEGTVFEVSADGEVIEEEGYQIDKELALAFGAEIEEKD